MDKKARQILTEMANLQEEHVYALNNYQHHSKAADDFRRSVISLEEALDKLTKDLREALAAEAVERTGLIVG